MWRVNDEREPVLVASYLNSNCRGPSGLTTSGLVPKASSTAVIVRRILTASCSCTRLFYLLRG